MNSPNNATLRSSLVLVALLFITGLIFAQGYPGGFHLDDQPNLQRLAFVSPGMTLAEALSFGLSQISGLTRLLPEASFILQSEAWPDDPGAFVTVNIALHLINGVLVFCLACQLAIIGGYATPRRIGLLTAAIWLLSPIQVSSVLYVIQRINQFAAFWTFLGAICYLHGRAWAHKSGTRGTAWMTLGVVGCGGLAVLSKENGALLPLLLLSAEATLLARSPVASRGKWISRWLLLGPMLLLACLLAWQHASLMAGYAQRDFGWQERLFSQSGILLEYLGRFLLPRGHGLGLFHDDYPAAQWPYDMQAWAATVSVVMLVAGATIARNHWPGIAFGILWFFAGHMLEASWIPLELYFEHRNYVPLFGPALALAVLSSDAIEYASRRLRAFLIALTAGWLVVASSVTLGQALLWRNPDLLVQAWYGEHPRSPRAIGEIAELMARQGRLDDAAEKLANLTQGDQPHPEAYGQWLRLACRGEVNLPEPKTVIEAFATVRYSIAPGNSLSSIANLMEDGSCGRLNPNSLVLLSRSLLANPNFAHVRGNLHMLVGRFLELAGRYEEALQEMREAYKMTGNPEMGFIELRLLLLLGRPEELAQRLRDLDSYVYSGGPRFMRYRRDIDMWRTRLP